MLICFRQILEEHRKNCERQGKYVEAEIAKNRYAAMHAFPTIFMRFGPGLDWDRGGGTGM